MFDKIAKRNNLAGISVESEWNSDNLIIVLCSYFENHLNCPDEEENDDGWKPWAVQKAYEALDLIVEEIDSSPLFKEKDE